MCDKSITHWIAELKVGEASAAQRLWEIYAEKLVQLARKQLGDAPRQSCDEEDIALSVFRTVCHAAANGRFMDLKQRDELWWLLLRVTRQKTLTQARRELSEKRGGGRVLSFSDLAAGGGTDGDPLEQLVSHEPTPEFLAILAEEHQRLLRRLRDDRVREVALRRMEGYTIEEIARQMQISTRTVQRKLQLIEEEWLDELPV